MSTNAIIYDQVTNRAIYVHFDGGMIGEVLTNHYTDQEKIDALISFGDVSSLGSEVAPSGEGHSFDTPEPGVTVFYGRDRGESGVEAFQLEFRPRDPAAFLRRVYTTAQYVHVWDGERWTWRAF